MRECSYCKKSHSRTIGGGTRQSKYCSPSCGRKARDKAVAGRYYQRAVQLKPKEALRVERVEQGAGGGKLDGKYLYVFLCKECGKNEVQYECHFFYSSKPKIRFNRPISFLCRGCANSHVWEKHKRPFEYLFNSLSRIAEARHIPVNMTLEEYVGFTDIHKCEYCEGKIRWSDRRRRERKVAGEVQGKSVVSNAHHLDRKDSSQGYSVANCVVCCGDCNRIKSNVYTYAQMKVLGQTLKQIKGDI